jgi:hypothetical protein
MISTRDLSGLPNIPSTRRLTQSLALLDAILCRDWVDRYYSFDSRWAPSQEMASMRDGCGDLWFCLFFAQGVCLHGLAHESPMYRPDSPWPGILESLPAEFDVFRNEPAFDTSNTSFCIWRRNSDDRWTCGVTHFEVGSDPDGSAGLLGILDGNPATYVDYAASYFEVTVPLAAVEAVYRHDALTPELVASLNPDVSLHDMRDDLDEIGYGAHQRTQTDV